MSENTNPEPQPHNPDERPDGWPTQGMTRHTLILKGIAPDGEEVPLSLTFEYPAHTGIIAVRTLRDYGKDLGLELMRQLHHDGDLSVRGVVETTIREFADKGIDLTAMDVMPNPTEGGPQ